MNIDFNEFSSLLFHYCEGMSIPQLCIILKELNLLAYLLDDIAPIAELKSQIILKNFYNVTPELMSLALESIFYNGNPKKDLNPVFDNLKINERMNYISSGIYFAIDSKGNWIHSYLANAVIDYLCEELEKDTSKCLKINNVSINGLLVVGYLIGIGYKIENKIHPSRFEEIIKRKKNKIELDILHMVGGILMKYVDQRPEWKSYFDYYTDDEDSPQLQSFYFEELLTKGIKTN